MKNARFRPAFVQKADGLFLKIVTSDSQASKDLLDLGFSILTESEYRITAPSETEKARLFNTLRDKEFCFARGQ